MLHYVRLNYRQIVKVLLVIAGGGLGAAARYGVRLALPSDAAAFPYATLVVNAGGSFLAGLVAGLVAGGATLPEEARLFLLVGVLGGFTTFSAFSLETVEHLMNGDAAIGAMNVLLSLLLCVAAVVAGLFLGRAFV